MIDCFSIKIIDLSFYLIALTSVGLKRQTCLVKRLVPLYLLFSHFVLCFTHDFTEENHYAPQFVTDGMIEDGLLCFHCGVVMFAWRANEDPWIRHARCSPQCQYLILQKGQEYVNSILELHGEYRTSSTESRINVCTLLNNDIMFTKFSRLPMLFFRGL